MRARYLGPNWELAQVRGTRFNTGDGIKMARDDGRRLPYGNWSGCHAVGWDFNAPEFGDLAVDTDSRSTPTRSGSWSMPMGAVCRRRSRLPKLHLRQIRPRDSEQPGNFAWQIFDRKVVHLLRDEYRIKQVTKVTADTLEELGRPARGRRRCGIQAAKSPPTTTQCGKRCPSIRTSRMAAGPRGSPSTRRTGRTPSKTGRSWAAEKYGPALARAATLGGCCHQRPMTPSRC